MVWFKEREPKGPPEGIVERSEEFEVSKEEKKTGMEPRIEHFTAQVERGGKKLIQTPKTQKVAIQLPTDRGTLVSWAKGPAVSSLTWFAAFWLRMIKKAALFGWKIVGSKKT
ncbi:hypothetical protein E3I18_01250 [Candidatus Woesebacteria bacterium]|nr:MAG: hypothetical protein E3I18_01250 [Candidatus Woesebacteria bacterium]